MLFYLNNNKQAIMLCCSHSEPIPFPLNLDVVKKIEFYYRSYKEHLKVSAIAGFGCEIL